MISTKTAIASIHNNIQAKKAESIPLQNAVGLVLAEDVYSTTDIPGFPQSSMDGFAFSFEGWKKYKKLIIEGEMAAGTEHSMSISPEKTTRVFTGAPIPVGADTVVMQERIRKEKGMLIIDDEPLKKGTNVRSQGSEIKAGTLALPKGTLLTPAGIGFLAGIGKTEVLAISRPSITIIVTGNELQSPGTPLKFGKVYESNSFALRAALQLLQINEVSVVSVHDDPDLLSEILHKALLNNDMVLLTGGVSVGDYDFVIEAAKQCGIQQQFHNVKQRPGKPLYFGTKENKVVFGLPGNPASVLTCFYMYVVPALNRLTQSNSHLHAFKAPLSSQYRKLAGLTHFLKGYFDGEKAIPLGAQESYRMHSFAQANCLIEIDEDITECKDGALVNVHLLPV